MDNKGCAFSVLKSVRTRGWPPLMVISTVSQPASAGYGVSNGHARVMPNSNPLDLGCAHGQNTSKAQENKGQNRVRTLRGRGPQTVQGAKNRDSPQVQKGLVSSLQFVVGHALSGNARSDWNHALQVVEVAVVERERTLVHVASRVLASVVRVGAFPRALIEVPERLNRVGVNVTTYSPVPWLTER